MKLDLHKLFGTTPGKGVQPKEAIAYSVTGIGQNFICTIIGSYITAYMTDALLFGASGVKVGSLDGAVAVAVLMLAARIFDALNDPIMGSIVDRTRTKWGKCRPYLKWMAIPIGVCTILCFLPFFSPEDISQNINIGSTFAIISILYVIWSVVYTVADVPYWGLATCMTNNTETRGNILTVARLACTVGAGLVTVLLPVITGKLTEQYKYPEFLDKAGNIADQAAYDLIYRDKLETIKYMEAEGYEIENAVHTFVGTVKAGFEVQNAETLKWTYFIAAVILVVAAIPMFFYGFKNTKEYFTTDENPPSFSHNIKLLFKNKELLLLVVSGVLGGARSVYTYTGGLYFAKYILHNEKLYGTITLLVVPGGLVASLLSPWLSKKFTKKWSYIIVHLFGGLVMLAMYFMGYKDGELVIASSNTALIVAAVCLILLGIPQGVNNIITYAMIGDTVDYLEWKTGERGEGICYAMQTLINKVGMAVGAFVGVMSLSIAQIDTKTYEVGNADALWKVLVLSGVFSFIACAIPMFFYTITEKKQAKMVSEIEARKANAK